jgi:hypothetical protein
MSPEIEAIIVTPLEVSILAHFPTQTSRSQMPPSQLVATAACNSPVALRRICPCPVCKVISYSQNQEGQVGVWEVIQEQKVVRRKRME